MNGAGLKFTLINAAGGATTSNGDAITPEALGRIAQALTVYANRDVASEYGGAHLVRAAAGASDIQLGEIPFSILATLTDAPDAIAYHDVDNQGAPDAFDAITLSDSLTGPGNSLSVALSHEIAETIADEGANLIAADGAGAGFAREACDPVEVQSYPITLDDGTLIYVSNFVLRSYFVPNHPGPYDFMSASGMADAVAPPGPLQVAPGGGGNYQITYSQVGGQAQVTGSIRRSRIAKKLHIASRTRRRGVAEYVGR